MAARSSASGIQTTRTFPLLSENQIECRVGQGKSSPPANQKPPDTMEGNALGISLSLPDRSRDANRASTYLICLQLFFRQ